jgi:hypothetical protein
MGTNIQIQTETCPQAGEGESEPVCSARTVHALTIEVGLKGDPNLDVTVQLREKFYFPDCSYPVGSRLYEAPFCSRM